MEQVEKKGISFKQFLDQSTNLITVFGVFNALFIYASTLDDDNAKAFLLPAFFIVSLLVWVELLWFTLISNDGSKKYEIFLLSCFIIQIGLLWYFIVKFAAFLAGLVMFGVFFLLLYLLVHSIFWIFKRRSFKYVENLMFRFTVLIISLFLSVGIFYIIKKPFVENVLMEILKIEPKQSKKNPV